MYVLCIIYVCFIKECAVIRIWVCNLLYCTVDLKTAVLPIHINGPKLMHLYGVSCLVSRTNRTVGNVFALTWQVSWPLSCPQWECRTCQRWAPLAPGSDCPASRRWSSGTRCTAGRGTDSSGWIPAHKGFNQWEDGLGTFQPMRGCLSSHRWSSGTRCTPGKGTGSSGWIPAHKGFNQWEDGLGTFQPMRGCPASRRWSSGTRCTAGRGTGSSGWIPAHKGFNQWEAVLGTFQPMRGCLASRR